MLLYTRFFYTDGFDDFTNSIDASIGLRNRKRTLGTTLTSSFLFGEDSSLQLVFNSFVNINIKRGLTYAIRFRPNISFIVAEQTYTFRRIIRTPQGPRIQRTTQDIFDLLNTQIHIPISMTINNWDFEVGYSLNLPNEVANESDLNTTGFFNFSVGYLFNFK